MQRAAPVEPSGPSLSGVIPSSLQYGGEVNPALLGARSMRHFPPESSGVYTEQNNTIRIPVKSLNFLDLREAMLSWDLKLSSKTADDQVFLDGGAACVIQRLRVLSMSGGEIERIEDYRLLSCILDQYTGVKSDLAANSLLSGTACEYYQGGNAVGDFLPFGAVEIALQATTGQAKIDAKPSIVKNMEYNCGLAPNSCASMTSTADLATGPERHFEFGLKMGWFQPTLRKLLPPDMPFLLEVTLASAVSSFAVAGAVSEANRATGLSPTPMASRPTIEYEIRNVLLKCPMVTINDLEFMNRVGTLKSRGYEWSATTYKLHKSQLAQSVGSTNVQIADRSMSLNALICCFRKGRYLNSTATFQNQRRSLQYIRQYQATIGADLFPAKLTTLKFIDPLPYGGTDSRILVTQGARKQFDLAQAYSDAVNVFGSKGVITPENFAGGEMDHLQGSPSVSDTPVVTSENLTDPGTVPKPGGQTLGVGAGVLVIDTKAYHRDRGNTSGIDTASQAMPISIQLETSVAIQANDYESANLINGAAKYVAGTGSTADNTIVKGNAAEMIQMDTYAKCDVTFVLMPGGEVRSMV